MGGAQRQTDKQTTEKNRHSNRQIDKQMESFYRKVRALIG